jgi:DNA mismatch repair protein MutS
MSKVTAKPFAETPLMKQYNTIKAKYPDAVLLFRVGDFYETFGEDAVRTSKILGIVLTKRANGAAAFIDLAGFPYHSLDSYLPKLVRAGCRVAICEQLEDPKLTKTIVKRDVTELVTPGLAFSDNVLEQKSNNWLCSVYIEKNLYGIAFLDVSTGEFLVSEGERDYIQKLLQSFRPSEILHQRDYQKRFEEEFDDKFHSFALESWIYTYDFGEDLLLQRFGTLSLKGFGIESSKAAIIAAGAILHYLKESRHERLSHIRSISRIDKDHYVWLDDFTVRNLELISSANLNATTLADVLDRTITSMGARMLRRRIVLPLKDIAPIVERLEAVDYLKNHAETRQSLSDELIQLSDLERMCSKIATGRIAPRETVQLAKTLSAAANIKQICESTGNPYLQQIADKINPCKGVIKKINHDIHPDAPMSTNKGNIINKGVNTELDELRAIAYSGKDYLLQMQQRESEKTGIPSLKIAFNNVFGYYIEVTNVHKSKVPEEWIRKQTLVNAERYITQELKEYEDKILGAEEKIQAIETRLYEELVNYLAEYIPAFQLTAMQLAGIDCTQSFALVAHERNYVKPEVNDEKAIRIIKGRHPVIETRLPEGENYIPNDIYLDDREQQIMIITGPNMSGKSAILRQTALIVLMAQMGSFVPAGEAVIGVCDKIFTRVGASDNLSAGESTFMVEMNETAGILNNLSDRSLVLLDEIGRGTSTYDGISIAWAIAEYIHEHPKFKAKTLFATHYHELNEMAKTMKRIKNYHVSVKETESKVVFLRKLLPGGSEHSFGIHVAEMAGMPKLLLDRAKEILNSLEKSAREGGASSKPVLENYQLSFFNMEDPVLVQIREEISRIDINILTPVEALMKLNEIKKLAGVK